MAILMIAASCIAAEQESNEIIVSATRVASTPEDVASSVTVITAKDIENQQYTTALDALKTVPGLCIAQNGGIGTTASIFIRGAESEQVLVLIDGIELNDPVSAGRAAYMANLSMENVERIEILRGSQSSLYGSDAIAGVISITTKKGKGAPESFLSMETGSFNTFKESAGISGGNNHMNYSFSATRIDSDGISAANKKDGNDEEDYFRHTSFSGRFGLTPSDTTAIDFFLRYIDTENEFDASGGSGGDAPDNVASRKVLLTGTKTHIDLFDSIWRQTIGASFSIHDRTSKSAWSDSTFDSQLLKFDWQNDLYLNKAGILTAGLEFETEEGT